jgi:hypothetical protein
MESLFNYYGVDWIGTGLMIVGVYLLSEKNKKGFMLSAISNIFWIGFGCMSSSIATILLNAGLMLINIKGFRNWEKE